MLHRSRLVKRIPAGIGEFLHDPIPVGKHVGVPLGVQAGAEISDLGGDRQAQRPVGRLLEEDVSRAIGVERRRNARRILHAVMDSSGVATAFYTDRSTHVFLKKASDGTLSLAIPAQVTDFSAGLDPKGHADVFAHRDGVMQEFTDAGWDTLNEPRPMQHFAAVSGGRLYAVADDNSLWEFAQAH